MEVKGVLSVVIPAYNEERRLGAALERVGSWLRSCGRSAEVIVVDDGSTDGTARIALGVQLPCRITVLRNPANQGKGAALRRGVLASSGELVLATDADLPVPLEWVSVLERYLSAGADVAVGSRRAPGAVITRQQPFARRVAGRAFNMLVRSLLGVKLLDTQCGFKLFRGEAARRLFGQCVSDGFAIDAEVLARALLNGYRVVEVAVSWAHSGGSSVRLLHHSLEMAHELLKIRLVLREEGRLSGRSRSAALQPKAGGSGGTDLLAAADGAHLEK
ncbi:MAG: dolichyl-phosphate beta-glucosyltransferase [Bacillota bacterium]